MKPTTIALAAGGSGGHFFPAEALARELSARGHRVVIYTDARGAQYAERLDRIEMVTLPAAAIGAGIVGKIKTARTILKAVWIARRDMKRRHVAGIVAFGGYPSFAPALAARSLLLPLILHEQATKVSLANSKLLHFATRLATSFPQVKGSGAIAPHRIRQTGNPVRGDITALRLQPYSAPTDTGRIELLVVGGSQSASVFGEIVPPALLALPEAIRNRLHLSLQYKGDDAAAITAQLAAGGIHADLSPFFRDMAERLARAHLVIGRAGASTIAELLVVGRPSILVPIPQGGSREEQRRNAETMEEAGTGWCMLQPDLTADALNARLSALFSDPARLATAAAAAYALGQPQAAINLADLVEATLV